MDEVISQTLHHHKSSDMSEGLISRLFGFMTNLMCNHVVIGSMYIREYRGIREKGREGRGERERKKLDKL